MHRKITIAAALLMSAGFLSACNDNNVTADAPAPADSPQTAQLEQEPADPNSEVVSAVQDAAAGLIGTITAEMTTTTEGFARAAAVSDMYEIQSSRLALQRSKSDAIKKFAQMMIDDHSMTSSQMKALVQTANANIQLPMELDDRRKGMMENLTGASEEDFDGRYVNQQTNAHQEALILMRGYASDGDNAELKQFAASTWPKVEQHLNMVKEIDRSGADNLAQPAGRPGSDAAVDRANPGEQH